MSMDNVEIVLGTYENFLIGYKLTPSHVNKDLILETSFTDDSHRGALRCLAISQNGVLASSSTDDSIRLHSLRKRKEIGGLFEHSGTVNSMIFYDKNHMFSASEDGSICLWQSKNWELMRTLKGHKAHVMAVAVHPSGKLGLSVGSDRSFLTWDLLTGKLAFQRKLTDVAHNVFFTPSGNHYILVYNRRIEVCSLSDTKVVKEIPIEWRINAVSHVERNVFAVGGDDQHVLLIDVLKGSELMTLDAAKTSSGVFRSRVRCICVIEQGGQKLLFMATAMGDIKAFKLDLKKTSAEEIFYGEARVRVTAMGVYYNSSSSNGSENETSQPQDEPVDETSDLPCVASNDEDDEDSDNSDEVSQPKAKKRKKLDKNVSDQMDKKKKKRKMTQQNLDSSEDKTLLKSKKMKVRLNAKVKASSGNGNKNLKLKRKNK